MTESTASRVDGDRRLVLEVLADLRRQYPMTLGSVDDALAEEVAQQIAQALEQERQREQRLSDVLAAAAGVQLADDPAVRRVQIPRWQRLELIAGKMQGRLLDYGIRSARCRSGNLEQPPQIVVDLEDGHRIRWILDDNAPIHVSQTIPEGLEQGTPEIRAFLEDPPGLPLGALEAIGTLRINLVDAQLDRPIETSRELVRRLLDVLSTVARLADRAGFSAAAV